MKLHKMFDARMLTKWRTVLQTRWEELAALAWSARAAADHREGGKTQGGGCRRLLGCLLNHAWATPRRNYFNFGRGQPCRQRVELCCGQFDQLVSSTWSEVAPPAPQSKTASKSAWFSRHLEGLWRAAGADRRSGSARVTALQAKYHRDLQRAILKTVPPAATAVCARADGPQRTRHAAVLAGL